MSSHPEVERDYDKDTSRPGDGPEKVIIDCDPGVDDFMALVLALSSPEIEVAGLTIVFGNSGDLDLLAKNACYALQVCGKSGIPVVKGCTAPLATDYHGHEAVHIHGEDGIGNIGGVPDHVDLSPLSLYSGGDAATFITETCKKTPGTVTVITLGPLTNLATAIRRDAAFAPTMRRHVMMGGGVLGRGNKTAAAEANVHNDPEACEEVLRASHDTVMAGLNLTHQLELDDAFLEALRAAGERGALIARMHDGYVRTLRSWNLVRLGIHDSSAILAVVRPRWFRGPRVAVRVEMEGALTRGMTIADFVRRWSADEFPHTTQVIMSADVDKAKAHLIAVCGDAPVPK